MIGEIYDVGTSDEDWMIDAGKSLSTPGHATEIFNSYNLPVVSKGERLYTSIKRPEEKTARVVSSMGFGAEGRLNIEWGDTDGVSVSGSVSGNVSDDNGNTAEVEVSVNDDGSGSASISVSHEEDD